MRFRYLIDQVISLFFSYFGWGTESPDWITQIFFHDQSGRRLRLAATQCGKAAPFRSSQPWNEAMPRLDVRGGCSHSN
jgi:hypothetical protein